MHQYCIRYNDDEQGFMFGESDLNETTNLNKVIGLSLVRDNGIDYKFEFHDQLYYNTIKLNIAGESNTFCYIDENLYVLHLLSKCKFTNDSQLLAFKQDPEIMEYIKNYNTFEIVMNEEHSNIACNIIKTFLYKLNTEIVTSRNMANTIVINESAYTDGVLSFKQGYNSYCFNIKNKTVTLNDNLIDWDKYNIDPYSAKLFNIIKRHYYNEQERKNDIL